MAGFHTKTFKNDDEYYTPKHAWTAIEQYIPKDKVIWEAFYGDGSSGTFLREMGFETICEDVDFFDNDLGDMIMSNPPFSKCKEIMPRLALTDKPFILIMPSSKINTNYFRDNFKDKNIQIIIPRRRIHFIKNNNHTTKCNFDCFYYCYKIGLENDITWLE